MEIKKLNNLQKEHLEQLKLTEKKLQSTVKHSVEYYKVLVELYNHKRIIEDLKHRQTRIKELKKDLENVDSFDYTKPSSQNYYSKSKKEAAKTIKSFIARIYNDFGVTIHSSGANVKYNYAVTKLREEESVASVMKEDYNTYINLLNKNENGKCTKKELSRFEKLQKNYEIELIKTKINRLRKQVVVWNSAADLKEIKKLEEELNALKHPILTKVKDVFSGLSSYIEKKLPQEKVTSYTNSNKSVDAEAEDNYDKQLLNGLAYILLTSDD